MYKEIIEVNLMNSYENKEKDHKEIGNYFPSHAFVSLKLPSINDFTKEIYFNYGKCRRASYFQKKDIEREEKDANSILKMYAGKEFEEQISEYLKNDDYDIDEQVSIVKEYKGINISSKADFIIKHSNKKVGLELKTGFGYYFEKEIFNGYPKKPSKVRHWMIDPNEPAPKINDILQTAIYLWSFDDIDEWYLIYKNRSSMDMIEYKIVLNSDNTIGLYRVIGKKEKEIFIHDINVYDILDNYVYIQNYLDKDLVPPRDYVMEWSQSDIENKNNEGLIANSKYKQIKSGKLNDVGDWQCAYCDYKTLCKSLSPNETKIIK
jgi:CRISPR/Cas system-associated exonuclease Cas4 (RecB family)